MKKLLFALVAVSAITLSSCNKDNQINRQLDGEWNVTSVDGDAIPSGSSMTYSFSRDKKGKGTGHYTGTGFYTGNYDFTYEVADEKLSMTISNSSITSVVTVKDHTKKKMTFVDDDSKEIVLEAK